MQFFCATFDFCATKCLFLYHICYNFGLFHDFIIKSVPFAASKILCYILPYFCSTFLFFVLHAIFVLHFSVRMLHFFDFVRQFYRVSNDLRSRFFAPKCHRFEFPKVILSDSQREMHILRGLILPDFHLLSPPQTVLFLPSNRSLYSRKPLRACLAHRLQLYNDLICIRL